MRASGILSKTSFFDLYKFTQHGTVAEHQTALHEVLLQTSSGWPQFCLCASQGQSLKAVAEPCWTLGQSVMFIASQSDWTWNSSESFGVKIQILGELATRQCIWVKFGQPQFLPYFAVILFIISLGKILHILPLTWRCVRWYHGWIQWCT